MADDRTKTLIFLCTGNYYRSRFAEMYFRHLAAKHGLPWRVESRGLQLSAGNVGPLSKHIVSLCERMGVCIEPLRWPQALAAEDFTGAELIIAVKEAEHRSLMRTKFPAWENRIEYWQIHDVDVAPPEEALPLLQQQVEALVEKLRRAARETAH